MFGGLKTSSSCWERVLNLSSYKFMFWGGLKSMSSCLEVWNLPCGCWWGPGRRGSWSSASGSSRLLTSVYSTLQVYLAIFLRSALCGHVRKKHFLCFPFLFNGRHQIFENLDELVGKVDTRIFIKWRYCYSLKILSYSFF